MGLTEVTHDGSVWLFLPELKTCFLKMITPTWRGLCFRTRCLAGNSKMCNRRFDEPMTSIRSLSQILRKSTLAIYAGYSKDDVWPLRRAPCGWSIERLHFKQIWLFSWPCDRKKYSTFAWWLLSYYRPMFSVSAKIRYIAQDDTTFYLCHTCHIWQR